jgi:hypothetical protein
VHLSSVQSIYPIIQYIQIIMSSDIAHWSSFGQPGGNVPEKRVQLDDWKTKPMKSPKTIAWKVPIQPPQLARTLMGFRPSEMEDKWFVYADGPDNDGKISVHLIRSWTGFRIAEVKINLGDAASGSGPGWIKEFVWESSDEVIRIQDEEEAKGMVRETFRWVLGVELAAEVVDEMPPA